MSSEAERKRKFGMAYPEQDTLCRDCNYPWKAHSGTACPRTARDSNKADTDTVTKAKIYMQFSTHTPEPNYICKDCGMEHRFHALGYQCPTPRLTERGAKAELIISHDYYETAARRKFGFHDPDPEMICLECERRMDEHDRVSLDCPPRPAQSYAIDTGFISRTLRSKSIAQQLIPKKGRRRLL